MFLPERYSVLLRIFLYINFLINVKIKAPPAAPTAEGKLNTVPGAGTTSTAT